MHLLIQTQNTFHQTDLLFLKAIPTQLEAPTTIYKLGEEEPLTKGINNINRRVDFTVKQ